MHVVEHEGESWSACLAFRNALRSDAGLRDAYAREERRAAAEAPLHRSRYQEIKSPFIAGQIKKL